MAATRDYFAAPLDPAQLAAETAALRREAADFLRRSRWNRDDGLRELLRERHWYVVPAEAPPRGHDR